MSSHPHHRSSNDHDEQGATMSYVVGFVLSLLFTAVPYYMVINKSAASSTLLRVIIGIAVLQMLIQIIFFLHLGRGPKPMYNIVFFGFTVATILIVVGGSLFIINNLHYNMAPPDATTKLIEDEGIAQLSGKETGACQGEYTMHKATITDGKIRPLYINARQCDRIMFINEDDKVREITFGMHPEHASYAGENNVQVRKGRPNTIILNENGTYQYHDHLDPTVTGYFTVSQ